MSVVFEDNPASEVAKRRQLLLFFDRPTEPCFLPKGGSVFQLPIEYFTEKYKISCKNIIDQASSLFKGATPIQIKNIKLPNLSLPLEMPYSNQFSLFVPKHRRMAGQLIDIFMKMQNLDDLIAICAYCQLRMNPFLFNYCLSVAILHRKDTKGLDIPNFAATFPDKFVDPRVIRNVRRASDVEKYNEIKIPVLIPQNYTASDAEPEQAVAYFREDIGVNLHHWHWHLVYPNSPNNDAIVKKDRRGELFYYMHQQIIARYNVERLCNKLERVRSYDDYFAPIDEAYFPKLNSTVASRVWPPRFSGSVLRDIERPNDEIKIDVRDLENCRYRILNAIEEMKVILPKGRTLPLDEETGIDILGNMVEASTLSPNSGYYGDIHNMGHVLLAYAHDPDYRYLELHCVMGDVATAMRDPIFYRWHSHIDDIFQLYKNKLPAYTPDKLNFPGICVESIVIKSPAGNNQVSTQWEQSTVDLGRGIDFRPRLGVLTRFTHLQHDEFTYVIKVENSSGCAATGTVRIFMAPVHDEKGHKLSFNDQRRLIIELDKFTASLPPGTTTIKRKSLDSSVTIPYERTFRDQSQRPGDSGSPQAAEFDFCGCGWPHHLLVPKGTKEGYPMVLFCMISNWKDDEVDQERTGSCCNAASYCGLRDRKYPDRRAMGFPFDRSAPVDTLEDFLTPNMATTKCQIKFTDTVRERPEKQ